MDVQHVVSVGRIDLDVVGPAPERVAGRRVRYGGGDLAPGLAAVVGQLDDLLAAEAAPGVGHAQCDAGARAGAGDGHAAEAEAVVARTRVRVLQQGPVAAVEL